MPSIKLRVTVEKEIELEFKDQFELEQTLTQIGFNGIKDSYSNSSISYISKCNSDEISNVDIYYVTGKHELSLSDGLDLWDKKKSLSDILNKKKKDTETLPLFGEV